MKNLCALSVLFLLLLLPCAALAEEVTVTASGKDAATAELNARVVAVRQVLQETADMDFLLSKMDMVRKEFILKSKDFTSAVTVLSSEDKQGVLCITATVTTDRDKIRQRLLGIDPKAVAAQPAVAKAPTPAPAAPASEAQPAPQAAVPFGSPLPDEEFLTLLVLSAPLEERLAAIRNGANPNAAVTDWEMNKRIMEAIQKDGRIKKAEFNKDRDAVFPGKSALMLVADDYLSTEQEAIAVMQALVAAGADINAKDYSGRNVLMYMQKHLWPDFFTAFLAHKPDLEAVMDTPKDGVTSQNPALSGHLGGSGSTPLLYSLYPMVPDEVKPVARKALLRAGADPNKKTADGKMLLPALAAGSTDLELFTLALESGAQPDHSTLEILLRHSPERENRTAMLKALLSIDTEDKNWKQAGLYEACKKFESPELIRLFLQHGADVNATQSLGYTLLMLNTIDPRCVPLLVEAGADINYRNQHPAGKKRTALMYALEAKKPDLALALLAAGADPNLEAERDLRLYTALLMEVNGKGRLEIVKALLDAGARLDVTDSRGHSLLHVASVGGGGVAMLELLVEKGLDVKAVEDDGDTVLFHAARNNKPEVIEWLIKAGCDVNRATDEGKTALHAALEYRGNLEAMEALLKAGANVNAVHQGYGAPLYLASGGYDESEAWLLLENGANANTPGRGGKTPLMRAVENTNTKLVALLLDAGADPAMTDEKGKTAWDILTNSGSSTWKQPEHETLKQRLKPPS
ncbi:ankyrin repeat domain-containing protein [Desulfovibrio sp. OttesenSCG-928-M16]|nr:ankyrin repeat domain-containing protein [Desulfovibrio sp. OttesenSCG-928-M16]